MPNKANETIWSMLEQTFRSLPTKTLVRFFRSTGADGVWMVGQYQKTHRGQYMYVSGGRVFAPELPDTPPNSMFFPDEIANVIADRPRMFAYTILPIPQDDNVTHL